MASFPLIDASKEGNLAEVRRLLDTPGTNVNAQNELGRTALSWASSKGHIEVVKALLAAGADKNLQDGIGKDTPLIWALENRHREIAMLLITAGANVNLTNTLGKSALFYAEDYDMLEALFSSGADPDIIDENNDTVLGIWAGEGYGNPDEEDEQESIVELILEAGADTELGHHGMTPLIRAAGKGGDLRNVNSLIEYGADVNAISDRNNTPLWEAARLNRRNIVRTLLENGANPNPPTPSFWEHDRSRVRNIIRQVRDEISASAPAPAPAAPAAAAPAAAAPAAAAPIRYHYIPRGSKNAITEEEIVEGNDMVAWGNRQNLFLEEPRYYKKSTYNSLNPKKDPQTREPITDLFQYKARIIGGKTPRRKHKRRSTLKKRKARKTRRLPKQNRRR